MLFRLAAIAVAMASLALASLPPYLIPGGDPTADPSAIVQPQGSNARFTVLTDAIIRMEYAPANAAPFVDAATSAIWNRRLPVPKFQVSGTYPVTVITTSFLELTYDLSASAGGVFNSDSLSVRLLKPSYRDPAANGTVWTPGIDPAIDNLGGTFHTLDGLNGPFPFNCTYDNAQWDNIGFGSEPLTHCSWGLISRAGWAIVDDSRSPVMMPATAPDGSTVPWFSAPPGGNCPSSADGAGDSNSSLVACFQDPNYNPSTEPAACAAAGCCFIDASNGANSTCVQRSGNADWYFFGHGIEYQKAIYEFTLLAGRVPIPRRHWTGVSWSRWGNSLNQQIAVEEVVNLTAAGFPLSTFVIDMQWHVKPEWGAYTWDVSMFADHVALIDFVHSKGLQFGMNIHDANGVAPYENYYSVMAKANGVDPASNETVQFRISNLTYALTLQDLVMQPLIADGNDFWWTDYQQGEVLGVPDCTGCNPTMILNHMRFMNLSYNSDRRGLIHSRYGGLGSHRYVSGFGGDVRQSWESLAFMAQFTATASNVLFQWGHEIMTKTPWFGYLELFTRVVQFGAFSPFFTCWGNDGEPNDLWSQPTEYRTANQRVLAQRAQLVPYVYTQAASSHETGLIITRPLYYEWPWTDAAYNSPTQYMFGDQMMVAPITVAGGAVTVWFPPLGPTDEWILYDNADTKFAPDSVSSLTFDLSHYPVFVRSGAIIPFLPYTRALIPGEASRQYQHIEWNVYAAAGIKRESGGWMYEDDGDSNQYWKAGAEERAATNAKYTRESDSDAHFTVLTTGTPYRGLNVTGRVYSVRLLSVAAVPQSIEMKANGGLTTLTQLASCPQSPPIEIPAGTWCAYATSDPPNSSMSVYVTATAVTMSFDPNAGPDLHLSIHYPN